MLPNSDLGALTAFRRELQRHPELSGEEAETARTIVTALRDLTPIRILTDLGCHGVAAVGDSGMEWPTVLFRAEFAALPIAENKDIAWASQVAGKSHVCGHDGHMTILMALGCVGARDPVAKGCVVLTFQPAEKDGSGALEDDFRMVTITHVRIGDPSFGVAPGDGIIYATLRAAGDDRMQSLQAAARRIATKTAQDFGLRIDFEVHDNFAASFNDVGAIRWQPPLWVQSASHTARLACQCARQKISARLAGVPRPPCCVWDQAKTTPRCITPTMTFRMI